MHVHVAYTNYHIGSNVRGDSSSPLCIEASSISWKSFEENCRNAFPDIHSLPQAWGNVLNTMSKTRNQAIFISRMVIIRAFCIVAYSMILIYRSFVLK